MISIVIPLLNEREAIGPLAEEISAVCGGWHRVSGEPWETIFVDDGSSDGSTEILRDLAEARPEFRFVKLRRNFGKSAALMAGFSVARGDRIVTMDADLQDDPAEIPKLVAKLDEGFDLVSGWKRVRRDPLMKRWPSRLFNWVTARLSGVPLHDFNCGLKAYRGSTARSISLYGELYRYIPVIGSYRGWRVTELPVAHRPRRFGSSKFGSERYLRGLLDLLTVLFIGRYQHRPLHLFGGLGLLMMAVGLAISGYLTVLKIGGAGIGTRPLLTLAVLLLVVGMQFLSLGLISEMIASHRADELREKSHAYQIEEIVDGGVAGESPQAEALRV